MALSKGLLYPKATRPMSYYTPHYGIVLSHKGHGNHHKKAKVLAYSPKKQASLK